MLLKKITYEKAVGFIVSAFLSACLSACYEVRFLSASLFIALLYLKTNPVSTAIAFLIGFLPNFSLDYLLAGTITAVVIAPIFLIFKAKKIKLGGKVVIFSILSTLPFVFLTSGDLVTKCVVALISIMLTPVFISAIRVLMIKRLKYKCSIDETFCFSALLIICGVGFINLFGYGLYRAVICLALIIIAKSFSVGTATVTAVILATAPSISSLSLDYFAYFTLVAVLVSVSGKKSRFLSGLIYVLTDLVFSALLKIHGAFTYLDVLYSVVPVTVFLFLPEALFTALKKRAKSLGERVLPRYAINRMRQALSGKLYDVSGVFNEMKVNLENSNVLACPESDAYLKIANEIERKVCETCPDYTRCKNYGAPDKAELVKILSVGMAKNKVSLIDLTKKFTERCGYVNSVIYEMNSLIGKYREKTQKNIELSSGKALISLQSGGVSNVLKNIAYDFSKTLEIGGDTEKLVADSLKKAGVEFVEILALTLGDDIEINVIASENDVDATKLVLAVSTALGKKMNVTAKTPLSLTHTAFVLRPAPLLDASFGLAVTKKYGSNKSGDTHSICKVDDGGYLIALSDGMGSGNEAFTTSQNAVALIESFYKAGLSSGVIINIVNKVLAISDDESFSAIDVLYVNLTTLIADFIKVGSPVSYVLYPDSIRIVEGNSLPLGILEDVSPSGTTLSVDDGATFLMVTDGISDAFGSSTDFISYLKTLKTKNPQSLADEILSYALSLENGTPKDDMTVIAVRIFKKAS